MQDQQEQDSRQRLIGQLEALAEEALHWVATELYRRDAGLLAPFGGRGRLFTRQELRDHLDFLTGAIALSSPVYFQDYVRWVAAVMKTRGAPVQMLAESLALLRAFLCRHLEPSAFSRVAAVLDAAADALKAGIEPSLPLYHQHLPPADAATKALTECLILGDTRGAAAIVSGAKARGAGYLDIATRLLQPALYAIGLGWQENRLTVAQEHLATAICLRLLTDLFLGETLAAPTGRRALFAGVERNQHVLGLRIVADAFELAGWSVQFLGANTPTAALVAQVDRWRPELVAFSASLVQHLVILRAAISVLRAEFGARRPLVMVGGIPINQVEGVWRRLGADLWSPNAEKAVAEAQ